ncbi:hypothetical protein GUJ93_ZPchr0010g7683 [Zizania palustris]|uniref:Uncharacterized protein n=1 Tax=Zizania palustris TaxID=103762 RepID=A0A8J5W767_ZIZPA|nr:hypothetical protein GUJ93_ZPchr0010g7683 [Zizania palustris]
MDISVISYDTDPINEPPPLVFPAVAAQVLAARSVLSGSTRRRERTRSSSLSPCPRYFFRSFVCIPLPAQGYWYVFFAPARKENFWSQKPRKRVGEEVFSSSAMEVHGKSVIAEPSNVIFLSTILNTEGPIPIPSHKCDKSCQNEHVFGNMYRCKLTGITHICDKNCNQRILYDNHSSLCRVSGQLFLLSPLEQQAVRGIQRKHEVDSNEGCSFKRRRGAQLHPSPFERSYTAVSPIPSQVGDGMDLS